MVKTNQTKTTFKPIKTVAGLKAFFRTYVARYKQLKKLQDKKKLEKKAIDKKYEQPIKALKLEIGAIYKHMYKPGFKLLDEQDRGVIVYEGYTFGKSVSDRLIITEDTDFNKLENLVQQKQTLIDAALLTTDIDSVDSHEIIKVKKTLNKNAIKYLIEQNVFSEEELLAHGLKRVKSDTLYVNDRPHQHVNEVATLQGTDKL